MRIQHNIMAMSAYRNYNTNTSAVAKNLEKLSSGYKINRAGDDAAGLAISEKMRAQITGLNAAQKNVKDGISLVKTAEGAMQEIQDMLNRMDYLATQSANGTYQDEVDREALQKEVNQLLDEIDRIADSANFNGIKLLDGSLDVKEATETIKDPTFTGMDEILDEFEVNDKPTMNGIQGSSVITHKDAIGDGKTSFELDLSNFAVEGLDEGDEITIKLNFNDNKDADGTGSGVGGKDDAGTAGKNGIVTVGGTASTTWDITVQADADGKVTAEAIAKALVEATKNQDDDGNDVFTVGLKPKSLGLGTGTAAEDVGIEYSVSAEGNVVKFDMTNDGYKAAAEIYDTNMLQTINGANNGNFTGANPFSGHFNVGVTITDENNAVVKTFTGLTDNSTSNINKGTKAAGTQLADVVTEPFNANKITDGNGFKFGNTSYVFALTDETLKGKYGDNVKVIDLRDLADTNDDGVSFIKDQTGLHTALSRLTAAAADNEMWSVQQNERGDRIVLREKIGYNGNGEDGRADLTTLDGIQEQVQMFTGIKANVETTEASGKALQLQIGDTSESFNQLQVSIGDMHRKALGLEGLNIGNAESAAKAIQTIKDAINNVSSVRGDLGAYQNRLEHTSNNLSIMAENIQDAESTIRDTDIAEEMMSYTKNNILVQSAQAMLAQANQVPQGVLQLLG